MKTYAHKKNSRRIFIDTLLIMASNWKTTPNPPAGELNKQAVAFPYNGLPLKDEKE